ncbi:hypothetical protein BGX30_002770, partial [Mortierella sp. GBA39]
NFGFLANSEPKNKQRHDSKARNHADHLKRRIKHLFDFRKQTDQYSEQESQAPPERKSCKCPHGADPEMIP